MQAKTPIEATGSEDDATGEVDVADAAMRVLVTRLARPHRSGGRAIERASLLSSGADFGAAMRWIEAHGGEPELPAATRSSGGLHSANQSAGAPAPLRFVMPAGSLG
jgi:hypothetical protein